MKTLDLLRGVRRRLTGSRATVLVNGLLVLALAGAGTWAYVFFTEPSARAAANTSVRTVPVMRGTVTATVTADGTVASASTASAEFETSGTVTEIKVKLGQLVKKGQVMARVDATDAKRELRYAQADLRAAQDALDRAEESYAEDESDSTEQAVTEAEQSIEEAEQAVEEAEDAVNGTVLTAPMAGTVVAINGSLGGSASGSSGGSSSGSSGANSSGGGSSGGTGGGAKGVGASGGQSSSSGTGTSSDAFIELADLTKMQVSASFSEVDATSLKAGQQATVTWNALADTSVAGKVTAIDPNATSSNSAVSYPATIALDSVPDGVKLGQTVSVSVVTGTAEDAVYINSAALTTSGNRRTVTVVDDAGQQTRTTVEVGLEGDDVVEITSGLTAGQQVMITSTESSSSGNTRMPGGGGFTGGGFTGGGFTGGGGPPGQGGAPAGGGGR